MRAVNDNLIVERNMESILEKTTVADENILRQENRELKKGELGNEKNNSKSNSV